MPGQHTLADAPPSLHISRGSTLGALFLGGFLTAILYGILCLQVYTFSNRSSNEKRALTYSVAALWLLSTCYIACVVDSLYTLLIRDFAYPLNSVKIPWAVGAAAVITSFTDVIVRSWFTYRIWILSEKRRILLMSLALLIVADFATGIWSGIAALPMSRHSNGLDKSTWLFYSTGGLIVVTDIYIAVCLCYQLYQWRTARLSRTTNAMLDLLMIYAVNTGLLTAIVVLGIIITRAAMPGNWVYLGLYLTLGPLYVNALMGSINARDWFRRNTFGNISIPLRTLQFSPPSNGATGAEYDDPPVAKSQPNHGAEVHIETVEHVEAA